MIIYPHDVPIILNDHLFARYGGHTDTTSEEQRQAAYWIAERQVSEDLETFLLPTIVTGTYLYNSRDKFLVLDHTWVQRIIYTRFIDTEETTYWEKAGTDNIYLSLRDDERGLVDVHWLLGNCNCTSHSAYPYKIQEVYEAGFPTGTSNRPDILLALTTYADIILNEIMGYGNEAPGDVGVQRFSNQQYTEERVKLLQTSFGTSPRAQFIKKQLEKHKRKRYVGLT